MTGKGYPALHDKEIADAHRTKKLYIFDAARDDTGTAVACRNDGGGIVHYLHQLAAVDESRRICLLGLHHPCHLYHRIPHGSSFRLLSLLGLPEYRPEVFLVSGFYRTDTPEE
jgi:hypothetical protein